MLYVARVFDISAPVKNWWELTLSFKIGMHHVAYIYFPGKKIILLSTDSIVFMTYNVVIHEEKYGKNA